MNFMCFHGKLKRCWLWLTGLGVYLFCLHASWALSSTASLPLLSTTTLGNETTYHLNIKIILLVMTLSVLPALLMTMTSFTRIIIVLAILRQALGIPNVPGNQILIGLALMMTLYVMMPVFKNVYDSSVDPYLNGKINEQTAFTAMTTHTRTFMLKQTRTADLALFAKLAKLPATAEALPFHVILPAFVISELKTAFQIGFLIFLPFLIIDLVTATVLMSMGMMMLSPMVISLPFKILFFVMVNGWSLLVSSLIGSFR